MRIFTEAATGIHSTGEAPSIDEVTQLRANLSGIRSIIAVASAKGGTGKSALVTNIAAIMALDGRKVAILDADLNSPSVATMLGVRIPRRLSPLEQVEAAPGPLGLRVASAALLPGGEPPPLNFLEDEAPVLSDLNGNAPVEIGYAEALRQLLTRTRFGALDLMLIDLAPGLDRLFQLARITALTGAIMVTQPSDGSARATEAGVEMARQCSIRVIGLIENMAGFNCDGCHSVRPLMPHGEVTALAKRTEVPVLGRLPFDPRLAECCDRGVVFAREYPQTPLAHQLHAVAREVMERSAIGTALPPA